MFCILNIYIYIWKNRKNCRYIVYAYACLTENCSLYDIDYLWYTSRWVTRADKQFNVLFLTQYACFHLFESLSVGNRRAVARPYMLRFLAPEKLIGKLNRSISSSEFHFSENPFMGKDIIKIIIKIANKT